MLEHTLHMQLTQEDYIAVFGYTEVPYHFV